MTGSRGPLAVTVYSDYVCPWCYVGQIVVDRLAAERPITVDWRPFFLRPDTPPDGMRLAPAMRARMGQAHERLRAMARDGGLEMVLPDAIPNTRRALEATGYARTHGQLEPFHWAVARLYYGEGLDVSDWAVLGSAAADADLDPAEMRRDVDSGVFSVTLERSIVVARAIGVTVVPTYVLGDRYAIVGAQPVEAFYEAIDVIDRDDEASAQVGSANSDK